MPKIKKFFNFLKDKLDGGDPPIRAIEFLDKFSNDMIYLCQDVIDKMGSPNEIKFFINTSFGTRELEKNGNHLKINDIELKNYLNSSKLNDIKYLQIIVQLVGIPRFSEVDILEDELCRIKEALEIQDVDITLYKKCSAILITIYDFSDHSGGG